MKKMFIIISGILVSAVFFFSFKTKVADDPHSDFVVMKVFEPHSITSSGLVISYGKGETIKADLKRNNNLENAGLNAETVNEYLNKLKREGYKLKAVTGGDYFSTYVFEKD